MQKYHMWHRTWQRTGRAISIKIKPPKERGHAINVRKGTLVGTMKMIRSNNNIGLSVKCYAMQYVTHSHSHTNEGCVAGIPFVCVSPFVGKLVIVRECIVFIRDSTFLLTFRANASQSQHI